MNDCSEELLLQCPHCDRDKEPKLYVNTDMGVFHCFRCGFKGSITHLANKYPNLYSSIEDSVSLSLFARLKAFTEANKPLVLDKSVMSELGSVQEIEEEDPQYDYLLNRGWTPEIISLYGPLKSKKPKYINRVIIPVLANGIVVYYTARDITGLEKQKYMNPVRDKDFIFQSKTPVDSDRNKNAFICEGIFDSFKLSNACAILGKTLSKRQHTPLYQFLKNKKDIYICLDPETLKESNELALEIDSWFVDKNIFLADWISTNSSTDLGDLSKQYNRTKLTERITSNATPAKLLNYI